MLSVPTLRIKPDPFTTNRSQDSYVKHGGFLPIFEKENAFDLLDQYDQIAIIDADIFIRDNAPNVFDDISSTCAWGGVVERDMPITQHYKDKITSYSAMQYQTLHSNAIDFSPNGLGYEFFNMGMIVINSAVFKPFMSGQTAAQFLNRIEFKDFIDGVGPWKWSTDQTLLNYFLKKYKVPVEKLSWKYNALYKGIEDQYIPHAYFIHFFLKDKLPNGGENVEELMRNIHNGSTNYTA